MIRIATSDKQYWETGINLIHTKNPYQQLIPDHRLWSRAIAQDWMEEIGGGRLDDSPIDTEYSPTYSGEQQKNLFVCIVLGDILTQKIHLIWAEEYKTENGVELFIFNEENDDIPTGLHDLVEEVAECFDENGPEYTAKYYAKFHYKLTINQMMDMRKEVENA